LVAKHSVFSLAEDFSLHIVAHRAILVLQRHGLHVTKVTLGGSRNYRGHLSCDSPSLDNYSYMERRTVTARTCGMACYDKTDSTRKTPVVPKLAKQEEPKVTTKMKRSKWQEWCLFLWLISAVLHGVPDASDGNWAGAVGYATPALAFCLVYFWKHYKKNKPLTGWDTVIGVIAICGMLRSNQYHRTPTVRDLVQEASGQKTAPTDETTKETSVRLLLARMIDLRKANDKLNAGFERSFVGSHLLKSETLSSPQVAADSLESVKEYCTATDSFAGQFRDAYAQIKVLGDNADYTWITNEYDAAHEYCGATEDLYQYASDPTQEIQVKNGKVHVTGVEGYNARIHTVNAAAKKLNAAIRTFEEEQKKNRQETGVTAADAGLTENK
jgi:hypothetical protein